MSVVFSQEESDLLDRIAIQVELERLSPIDRTLIELRFGFRRSSGYTGPLPASKRHVGEYVGRTYLGRPLSATESWERTARVLERWKRRYHDTLSNDTDDMTADTSMQTTTTPPLRKAA